MYRDDLEAAHARVEALEQENRGLLDKLAAKQPPPAKKEKKKVKCYTCGGRFFRMFWTAAGSLMGLGCVAALLWLIITAAAYHGEGDHCYVEQIGKQEISLKRVIEWGADRQLGWYKSLDLALEDAKKLNCPVK